MKLLSVNVSQPKAISYRGKTVRTGIFKEPVKGRVMLRRLNLDGDGQGDLNVHGGPDKAVYVYTVEHYDFWAHALGRNDFAFGQFGENFTVEGMPEERIHIGDLFRVGSALVEVSQPRVPCYKLGLKMGSTRFIKQFLTSGRVGFYLRVLEEGEVGAGDPSIELRVALRNSKGDEIHRVRMGPEQMTIREIVRLAYFDPENVEAAQRAIRIPALSPGWREMFEERLLEAGLTVRTD